MSDENCRLNDFPIEASPKDNVPDAAPPAKVQDSSNVVSFSRDIDWLKADERAGWLKSVESLPANFSKKGKVIVAHTGNIADLNFDMEQAGVITKRYQSWSEVAIGLAAIFKNHGGFSNEQIAAALMCELDCNQHVTKHANVAQKRRAVERAILRSHEPSQKQTVQKIEGEPDWRERYGNSKPKPSMHNARLAIAALGIDCSWDTFHNKTLFGYAGDKVKHELASILGEVSDNGILALRQLMSDRFGFDMEDKATRDAVKSLALQHCFDPVRDMIDKAEAEWDRVERLDRMAVDYFNCEDTPINRAFMRKTMIGLIARARVPGIKFDTITVLEFGGRLQQVDGLEDPGWRREFLRREDPRERRSRGSGAAFGSLDSRERRSRGPQEDGHRKRQGLRQSADGYRAGGVCAFCCEAAAAFDRGRIYELQGSISSHRPETVVSGRWRSWHRSISRSWRPTGCS